HSKPHPQMLFELMDDFGTAPAEVVMIGDTTHDLNMAQAAGVDALSVQSGAHPPRLLNQVPHLKSFRSINELAPWLIQTLQGK
ncbi:HAD family hydrolase, partial [Limnobacter sp.]|uniref:HAD family hydrolase n=1 Tax=Limnobacter sp. TaxID=2003368 RepID=UPI003516E6E2